MNVFVHDLDFFETLSAPNFDFRGCPKSEGMSVTAKTTGRGKNDARRKKVGQNGMTRGDRNLQISLTSEHPACSSAARSSTFVV